MGPSYYMITFRNLGIIVGHKTLKTQFNSVAIAAAASAHIGQTQR